ncbi:flippase [Shewanella dokdonensis]|uniref:Flippase n=1 Tax=Shewanella dokdonensis TaxID=712036 RepID=A0ABX8DHK0_9GAMM|nr:flippase [Shewanella dokdonensis]MCL1073898.1 flippase [Shewanella dokdonensis]QVK23676.1 flippase [Shewanella dokdonensis]
MNIQNMNVESGLAKVLRNFGWLFIDKATKLIVGFFVSVLIARYLGAEALGSLSYALAYTALFQAMANFGLDAIAVRDMARNYDKSGKVLNNIFVIKAILALLFVSLGVVIAFAFLRQHVFVISIVIFSIFFSLGNVIDLYYQSISGSKYTVISKFKSYAICVIARLLIVYCSFGAVYIFLMIPIEALLSTFFLFSKAKSSIGLKFIKLKDFDKEYAVNMIKESWPLALSAVSIIVFMRIGVFFIEKFKDTHSVGIYAVGTNLAEISYFIPTLLVTSFAPLLAKAKATNIMMYTSRVKMVIRYMFYGAIGISVIFGLLGYILLPILYGAEYVQSKYVFAIHVLTLIPVSLGCAQSLWIVNANKTKITLWQTFLAAILSFILNIILVPMYGVIGAAIATLTTQVFQSFIFHVFLCRELFFLTWKTILFR